jgi:hypothetical protein
MGMGVGIQPSTALPTAGAVEWPIDAPPKKNRPLTKFQQCRRDLSAHLGLPRVGVDWYFENVGIEQVIEKLGWWNPLWSGRPRPFAQKLLDGIPSPCPGSGQVWKMAGLMYFTPPVVGRLKSRNRTSVAGLALLKHWADRSEAFAKFLAPYYSAQAEAQITLDCIDLALGTLPTRFRREQEANRDRVAKKLRLDAEAQRLWQAAHQKAAQATTAALVGMAQPSTGLSTGLYSGHQRAIKNTILFGGPGK